MIAQTHFESKIFNKKECYWVKKTKNNRLFKMLLFEQFMVAISYIYSLFFQMINRWFYKQAENWSRAEMAKCLHWMLINDN